MSEIELKDAYIVGKLRHIAATGEGDMLWINRHHAAALLSAIDAPAPQWQPIESAPKDGTPILACYAPHYETNGFLPVAVRWRAYHPNARGNEEWRDSSGAKVRAITHWQPLPAPPEERP